MEWRPAGWSVCLPLLIFPCTIKSRSSLLAPAHPGGPGKKAVKRLCVLYLLTYLLYGTSRSCAGRSGDAYRMQNTQVASTVNDETGGHVRRERWRRRQNASGTNRRPIPSRRTQRRTPPEPRQCFCKNTHVSRPISRCSLCTVCSVDLTHAATSAGNDLNKVIYKQWLKSINAIYGFDLNHFSSAD